jgi:hypothetical protein
VLKAGAVSDNLETVIQYSLVRLLCIYVHTHTQTYFATARIGMRNATYQGFTLMVIQKGVA